ncbi:hypothetical protein A2533_04305 [Candidatus Falkowbacteria bacterium RIFOXYD2_FULL_35_9]|uniref:DOD-type homing endonuclease domain-containing protein n=1 Tax=Candidatus Falkowbacteria bacterium RIFOXYC2_FULL_36_12 TaxID=1798002 RepID=A0A1F5SZ16_9BACT|nr:MAG: hypothetical protein A2478_05525 [Candidatus Falkowbacteria bacterium RIFOXYC2_FULL_36_12]OGF34671.1 MAG: hypothetical protein A2223_02925 [Candidatus Falkowbacteria bacterium RIFOXYA2_FULL_35_8]OGF46112.1 MAG: hypothetical protein A2533_04305 [Candidatus Falkowbacteria bacterium RIFOXYD2_FULL_35_9]
MSEKHFVNEIMPETEKSPTKKWETILGKRYTELLAERKKLDRELKKYNFILYNNILVDKEIMPETVLDEIADEVKTQLEANSTFFQTLNSLGIEILKRDLTQQPNVGGKIIFDSEQVFGLNLQHHGPKIEFRGQYEPQQKEVHIGSPMPELRKQLVYIIRNGALPDSVYTLIHELIHFLHYKKNRFPSALLTEAQAYVEGYFHVGSKYSLRAIAETLQRNYGGIMKLSSADEVLSALEAISGLYAVGFSARDIADLVSRSWFDYELGKFTPIETVYQQEKEEKELGDLDTQAMRDLMYIRASNNRKKAQLAVYRAIANRYDVKKIAEQKKKDLRKAIAYPVYKLKTGETVPSFELRQKLIVPVDKKYPYTIGGKRSGIIFGYFIGDGNRFVRDEGEVYGFGRFEADGEIGHIDLAETPSEQKELLDDIKKYSGNIEKQDKFEFIGNCLREYTLQEENARKILKALVSKTEVVESFMLKLEDDLDFLDRLIKQINQATANVWSISNFTVYIKNLTHYRESVDLLLKDFDITIEELDSGFTEPYMRYCQALDKLKAKRNY